MSRAGGEPARLAASAAAHGAHCPVMLLAVLPLLTGAGALLSHASVRLIALSVRNDGPVLSSNERFPPIEFEAIEKDSGPALLASIWRLPLMRLPSMKLPSVSPLISKFPRIVESWRSANVHPLHV